MNITKCKGEGCNKKESCYLFTCAKSIDQDYIEPSPVDKDGGCEFYWEVVKK